ncbi:hypothetical protein V6N13_037442 [Hibiscus sabdariffa]|uniref:Uncharacterized protein n=1 Tax=Hibiscus sabdariffa TaxID=183260 RepID=A0ABR2E9D4_9ROSI
MFDLAINTTLDPKTLELPHNPSRNKGVATHHPTQGLADFSCSRKEFLGFCSLVYSGGLSRDLFVNSWRLKIQVHQVTEKSNGCRFLRLKSKIGVFLRLTEERVFKSEVADLIEELDASRSSRVREKDL